MKMDLVATPRGWKVDFAHPVTGERIRKVLRATNKTQALEMYKHLFARMLVDRGALPRQALSVHVNEAAERYLIQTAAAKRPKTRVMDKAVLDRWKELKGELRVYDCTDGDVFDFINQCQKAGLKGASINRYVNVIRAFYGWCFECGYMDQDLRARIKRVNEHSRESRRLSTQEIACVVAHATPMLRLQIRIAATLGLRAGEVVSLEWSSIDIERRTMRVGGTESFVTKNGQSREVAIPEQLLSELRRWRSSQSSDGQWVFPNKAGTSFMDSHVVTRSWARARQAAKITNVKFHDLRATAATLLADQGLGEAQVGKHIGHKTAAMARKYSRDTTSEPMRDAVTGNERRLTDAFHVGLK